MTAQVLTRGSEVETLERLADGVGIGEAAFVAKLKQAVGRVSRETSGKRAWRRRVTMGEVLQKNLDENPASLSAIQT
jgi:hypothetical protein